MLGRPEKITPFLKSTPGLPDSIKNNGLAILEYPHATATIRACSLEVDGLSNRRLKICGTKGTIELCPLERFDGKPLTMQMILLEGNCEYPVGAHTIDFGVQNDRYQAQLLEFAGMIRGTQNDSYTREHDYQVHETTLEASGLQVTRRQA